MTVIPALKAASAYRCKSPRSSRSATEVNGVVARLLAGCPTRRFLKRPGVTPDQWPVAAVIHEREAGDRWDRQLWQATIPTRSRPLSRAGEGPIRSTGQWSGHDAFQRGVDALTNGPPVCRALEKTRLSAAHQTNSTHLTAQSRRSAMHSFISTAQFQSLETALASYATALAIGQMRAALVTIP
jgi:hypothetical protein